MPYVLARAVLSEFDALSNLLTDTIVRIIMRPSDMLYFKILPLDIIVKC